MIYQSDFLNLSYIASHQTFKTVKIFVDVCSPHTCIMIDTVTLLCVIVFFFSLGLYIGINREKNKKLLKEMIKNG